jgi:hypothetical protein
VRKEIVFNRWVWNLLLENGKVFFNTIEIKDWQQSLRKMELSLQELLILLIRLDVSIDSSVGMLE